MQPIENTATGGSPDAEISASAEISGIEEGSNLNLTALLWPREPSMAADFSANAR
jgi:hypothetical protein